MPDFRIPWANSFSVLVYLFRSVSIAEFSLDTKIQPRNICKEHRFTMLSQLCENQYLENYFVVPSRSLSVPFGVFVVISTVLQSLAT
jgi:hypothetical protein